MQLEWHSVGCGVAAPGRPLIQLALLGQVPKLSCLSVVSEGMLALTVLWSVLFSRLYLMTASKSSERQVMIFSPFLCPLRLSDLSQYRADELKGNV